MRKCTERSLRLFCMLSTAFTVTVGCSGRQDSTIEFSQHKLEVDAAADTATGDEIVAAAIKYKQYVAGTTVVGAATSAIQSLPGGLGKYQTFEHGVIVYSPDTGAFFLSQQIFDRWLALQGTLTADGQDLYVFLRAPIGDLATKSGYTEVPFAGGRITFNSGGTPHIVYGEIEGHYGPLSSQLGAPISDEITASGGHYQEFTNGKVYTKAGLGTSAVLNGVINNRWQSLGGIGGSLGFPVGDVLQTSGIMSARFENGAIYASSEPGNVVPALEIRAGDMIAKYDSAGGPKGWLGLPKSTGTAIKPGDTYGDDYINFQHGILVKHYTRDSSNPATVTKTDYYMFGKMQFHLTKFSGRCGFDWATSCDTYGRLTVSANGVAGRVVNSQRFPSSGDHSTVEVNQDWTVAEAASSDLTVDVELKGWDAETWPWSDEWIGDINAHYDIFNLWGMNDPEEHNGYDTGDDQAIKAYFRMKNSYKCQGSDFRACYWWNMPNVGTDELDWETYSQSFSDVDPDENHYLHPLNWLYYELLYQGIAEPGNCYGMTMEGIDALVGRSGYGQPIYETVSGDQSSNPSLWHQFHVQHGRQLGLAQVAYFVSAFLAGKTHDPALNFDLGWSLHVAGRHSLMMIYDSYLFGGGHVVLPYDYRIGVVENKVAIADSNHPYDPANPAENLMTINRYPLYSSYEYQDGYSGNSYTGGRMLVTPYDLVRGEPRTALALFTPWELIDNGMTFLLGDSAKVAQITDSDGKTFFKPGLPGLPAKWDDIQDDASRVPKLAPVPGVAGGPLKGQMYVGRGFKGESHTFEVVGTTVGATYKAGFSTAMLGSHFEVPGTPDKADIITVKKINTSEKAMALRLPTDGVEKRVAWTVSGVNRNLWTRLSDMRMVAGQEIAMRAENGGARILIDNQGPDTDAAISVTDAIAKKTTDGGRLAIPSGTSSVGVRVPVALCKDVSVEATEASCAIPSVLDAGSFDPDGATLTVTQSPAGPYGVGTTNVTLTAINKIGLSSNCTAKVTVLDHAKPQFTLKPANVFSDPCTGKIESIGTAEAQDSCGSVIVTNNAPATFPVGVTIVTWTATDAAGNINTYDQTVTVITDTTRPVFTSRPANVVANPCTGAPVIGVAKATDNCGAVTVTNNAPATFSKGTTTVTWTAKDTAGNVTEYVQTVRVDDAIDMGTEHAISSVKNNACLQVTKYPASWAPYMKTMILQPQATGTGFPIPFTWKNCTSNKGSGTLPGPWQQGTLKPIDRTCKTLIQLGGNGAGPVSLTWWGNG